MNATTLEVEPFEVDRFLVESASRPEIKHLVDLNHEGGVCCSCEDFEFQQDKEGYRCIHIKAVLAQTQLSMKDNRVEVHMKTAVLAQRKAGAK